MKPVGSWNLEGSSTLGRLGLEGLFDIRYSNLFTSGSISAWMVVDVERIFAEYFGFLFNNTSQYYFVFALKARICMKTRELV